jgi:hypothetical protein
MGAARGIDEGLIGTTCELEPFKVKFGLADHHKTKAEKAQLLSNITSMVQMGSILGVSTCMFLLLYLLTNERP